MGRAPAKLEQPFAEIRLGQACARADSGVLRAHHDEHFAAEREVVRSGDREHVGKGANQRFGSLDVQRELPLNIAITVGYVGSKCTRLRSNFNPLNALPFDALRLGLPLLNKRLADVTPLERQYAASLGFPLTAPSELG